MKETLCIILGGGQGSRLFPLTKDRSKPAVPIGGKYRLIDIPVSNCLNSNINRIFILTQFNSASLNKHINHTYRFDSFHRGFVDILAAEQSMGNTDWYQGTADAVRKNLRHVTAYPEIKQVLILSGDQIYTMDFKKLLEFHNETCSDVTISLVPVERGDASSFGLVKLKNNEQEIGEFIEKPNDPEVLDSLNFKEVIKSKLSDIEGEKDYLASMGIYLFNIETLIDLLDNNYADFGREIIPFAIETKKVSGYLFNGYWEDVGTIKAFWKANIDSAMRMPKFNYYNASIYTHSRNLPASKIFSSYIDEALMCEGSIVQSVNIRRSVVGIRSIINIGVEILSSIVMGADFYESVEDRMRNIAQGVPDVGIGENTIIVNAIIDKNARIGKNCKIINHKKLNECDGKNYYIRDGIVIIPKGAIVPDDSTI